MVADFCIGFAVATQDHDFVLMGGDDAFTFGDELFVELFAGMEAHHLPRQFPDDLLCEHFYIGIPTRYHNLRIFGNLVVRVDAGEVF